MSESIAKLGIESEVFRNLAFFFVYEETLIFIFFATHSSKSGGFWKTKLNFIDTICAWNFEDLLHDACFARLIGAHQNDACGVGSLRSFCL